MLNSVDHSRSLPNPNNCVAVEEPHFDHDQ